MEVDLSTDLGFIKLKNPVLVASGTFGYGQEYARLIDLRRLGGIVTKSVTLKPRLGNSPQRIVETTAGMLNSIGLANPGVEDFITDKMPFLRSIGTTVIVNVAGSSVEEYEKLVERLDQCPGIDALELNLSCPNVKGGMAFSSVPRSVTELIKSLRPRTRLPLIAKLTPNVTDISSIALAAEAAGADALSLINTLVGMAVDIRTRRPKLSNITGGLSGPAIKPVALAMVFKTVQAVSIPVIGIGGIFSTDDALEFFIVGAKAIQVGTANFIDPSTSMKIIDGLEEYCRNEGISKLSEIIKTLKLSPITVMSS